MKSCIVSCLAVLLVLLTGCFSGKEYPSGLLDYSALRENMEEQQTAAWQKHKTLRLGVPAGTPEKQWLDLQKKCSEKGLKLTVILCKKEWMTGFLRNGKLDLICHPDLSSDQGIRMGFRSVSGNIWGINAALIQFLN